MEAITGFIATIVVSTIGAAWIGICIGIGVQTFHWFSGLFS